MILCNSLVWTCELTGRPGLTYLEAVESEERARASLMAMPVALKRALLYLARHSNRGRLSDLCDDVFYYVKDRFFVGEEVEGVVDGNRYCSHFRSVFTIIMCLTLPWHSFLIVKTFQALL